MTVNPYCPVYAPYLSQAGITFAAVLSAYGAAYGTARSGIAIAAVGTGKPEIIVKSLLPVIMAGILSLYGMVIAIFIALCVDSQKPMSLFAGALQMGAGLSVGLACLAAGLAIGTLGDAGVRGYARQNRLLNGFILLLVFAEILGIYGLISAAMLINTSRSFITCT